MNFGTGSGYPVSRFLLQITNHLQFFYINNYKRCRFRATYYNSHFSELYFLNAGAGGRSAVDSRDPEKRPFFSNVFLF